MTSSRRVASSRGTRRRRTLFGRLGAALLIAAGACALLCFGLNWWLGILSFAFLALCVILLFLGALALFISGPPDDL
ncbi:hypothetical protein VD659_00390 [Herbiconiux sp. 11R-BC]|uniref:hypothetical protein n=1 Tax=Herbiconiux sp. 11R-BC TaxID=3111637 RepID=UPI003C11B1C4